MPGGGRTRPGPRPPRRRAVVELDHDRARAATRPPAARSGRRRRPPRAPRAPARRRTAPPREQPLAAMTASPRAERRPGLRQLDADDAAAEDREPLRDLVGRGRLAVRPRARSRSPSMAGSSARGARWRRRRPCAPRASRRPTTTRRSPSSWPRPRSSATPRSSSQAAARVVEVWITSSRRRSTPPRRAARSPSPERARPRRDSPGRSSAFDGMQAQNEHSPPTSRSSTIATASPVWPSRPRPPRRRRRRRSPPRRTPARSLPSVSAGPIWSSVDVTGAGVRDAGQAASGRRAGSRCRSRSLLVGQAAVRRHLDGTGAEVLLRQGADDPVRALGRIDRWYAFADESGWHECGAVECAVAAERDSEDRRSPDSGPPSANTL